MRWDQPRCYPMVRSVAAWCGVLPPRQQWQGRASARLSQDITDQGAGLPPKTLALNVFTHAREGIVVADPGGSIVDCNASFSRITGYAREELLGTQSAHAQFGAPVADVHREMWRTLLTQASGRAERGTAARTVPEFAEHLTLSAVRDVHGVFAELHWNCVRVTALHEHRRQLSMSPTTTA